MGPYHLPPVVVSYTVTEMWTADEDLFARTRAKALEIFDILLCARHRTSRFKLA